jgi:hypothetical protein
MQKGALVTITAARDVAAANVIRGVLEVEEIESFLLDEQTAGNLWHLGGALGGVRVQVRAEDEARAREVLDHFDHPAAPEGEDVSADDRAAARALRVAVIGFFLWPILHPYSLSLAIRSLGNDGLSPRSRRHARVALGISLASLTGFFVLLYVLLAG